jgi:hypothetical protein
MIRLSNQFIKKVTCFVVITWLMIAASSANASPPACPRNDVSMYMRSDAVVEAIVVKSRRWSEGAETLHLVAKYRILNVFKGNIDKDDILIATDTCLDKPVPKERLGYPALQNYCRGLIGLRLTGVDSRDGKPVMKSGNKPIWILFLKKDIRKGAPQLTWLEVSRTSYYGGCRQTRDDIPPEQRKGFDRLLQRLKIMKR